MVFSDTLHTLRLRNYFTRTFIPRFQALEKAASQTRLIIMLWASQSTELWCTSCKQIVGELERLGHTVFYNEQLGVSTAMRRKKGVEYTASDTLDLIVAVQPAFDPIGDVPDFEEFIVADSKMLLFIDQAAPDRPLYQQSLNEMSVRYNNVDS